MSVPRILVVGGGITGLAAAVELVDAAGPGGPSIELWEADHRLGGKLATSPFAGLEHVDEAADAFLTRVPHAVRFASRLGFGPDALTSPTDAHAAVWYGRLHPLPGGIMLGLPAAIAPLVTTSLLSWHGKLRAAAEPLLPGRFGARARAGDALGPLVRARFGNEVHDRLVDALVGSIYAADTDHASIAAVPQIAALAEQRSLLLAALGARRKAAATTALAGPVFAAVRGGMASLVGAAGAHIAAGGGVIRTGERAGALERDGAGWRVADEWFDAVVLASPARATAPLLAGTAPEAAELLAGFEHADIAMVRLAVPGAAWPSRLYGRSGYLVPKSVQRTVTAASFGSQKWAHWRPATGDQVLRISLGRDGLPIDHLDDDALLEAAVAEVGRHIEVDLQPTDTSVTRWRAAFPQYRPRHHARVAALEAALPPGVLVAGASYHGIGMPACIASGIAAAERVQELVGNDRNVPGRTSPRSNPPDSGSL